ncbi:MAG TPA: hypothetical protein PLO51_03765, partial [Candidatus Micrarchaeota archaeon]|nr:hypothetical protein [Candidatus Micrarchaeota archaeon]
VPRGMAAGTYSLPVSISFKDTNNQLHVINRSVQLEVLSGPYFGASGASGAGFAGRTRGFTIFGFDLVQIGIVVVVLLAAFFGYRHFKGKKKESAKPGVKA